MVRSVTLNPNVNEPPMPNFNLIVLLAEDPEALANSWATLGFKFVSEQHDAGPLHFASDFDQLVLEIYPKNGESTSSLRLGLDVPNLQKRLPAIRRHMEVLQECEDRVLVRDLEGHTIELTTAPISGELK